VARGFKLGAAAVAVAIAGMLASVGPAGAEGATGTAPGTGTKGFRVNVGGVGDNPTTMLLDLTLSTGANLKVYCVEIRTDLATGKDAMVEVPWANYPDSASPFAKNGNRINWLLHHGFPVVSLKELQKTLTAAGAEVHGGLSEQEAITATQAAAWHFSDGTDLNTTDPLLDSDDKDAEADVLALYDYLIDEDGNVGIDEAKTPTLAINPGVLAGDPGTRIGPFTVSTTGEVKDLKQTLPDGVRITDKDGKDLAAAAIKNGTQLFFDVPAGTAPGSASVDITATAEGATGRLFVGRSGKAQSLIVAQAQPTLTANAQASWPQQPTPVPQAAAGPDEDLASTGFSTLAPIGIGVGLIAAGFVLFMRRRARI
jgi:TQXA domain-containing protein/LPXTG-motif cell wall-anchored protein